MKIKKTFLFLISAALYDLIIRFLPQIKKQDGFAFLGHPRHRYEIAKKYPIFKLLPERVIDFVLKHLWPVTMSKIEGLVAKDGRRINGWLIIVPMTPVQMTENRDLARKRITQSATLAARKGAKIMGLGGLTASFSRGGLDILEEIKDNKIKIGITTGRAYTSWTVTQNVFVVAEKLDLKLETLKVAVVGAAGSIGSACASILLKNGVKNILLIDIDRKKDILNEFLVDHKNSYDTSLILTSHRISDIKGYDIVISATNAPEAKIKSDDLSSGTVIVDDAQPSDVDPDIVKTRDDVLVIEGGVIHAPGINPHFNIGLKHKEDIYCCLAEIMVLAYADWNDNFSVGRLTFDSVEKIANIAKDMGFHLADFQNFQKVITNNDIEKIKRIIKNRNS
jgi:fatty aldehyde-generating acyl-ACP reductase